MAQSPLVLSPIPETPISRQAGHRGGTDYAVEIDAEQDSDCFPDKRCN